MKKHILFFAIFFTIFVSAPIYAEGISDLKDKIFVNSEEIVLSDTKFKHVSFYNLKIYNNSGKEYLLKSINKYSSGKILPIKDLYKYYLAENETEGRFPYTFEVHLCALLSTLTPVTFIMYWAAWKPEDSKLDEFVIKPAKSIILLPTNISYKIKEGRRNKIVKKELKKYFKFSENIDYSEYENIILEPNTEIQIPIVTNEYCIILEDIETGNSYRITEIIKP